MNTRKFIAVVLMVSLLTSLTGCEAVQKKFRRKKKAELKRPRIYQLKRYEKRPTPELYKKHYAYWESWQSELVRTLGQNSKKDARSIAEITGQLKDMRGILITEKADELQKHIDRLMAVREMIESGQLSQYNRTYIKSTIESEERVIRRKFCYSSVKDHLKKSFEEEETAAESNTEENAAQDAAPPEYLKAKKHDDTA